MKKSIVIAWLFVLILGVCATAMAEKASYGTVSFDVNSEYINMGGQKIDDYPAFYTFLAKFPNLKKVDMFETPVWRQNIEDIEAHFPNLEFGWTIRFEEHEVRTDATVFSTLHMSNAQKHGDKSISLLRYCKNLKALDIGHNSVTDLSFLYEMPELRVLIVAVNKIEDITPIASLKKLEYLELFTNNIRDISPLTGLDHLMDLNISYNYIQDISPIFTLKSLNRLWTYLCINRGMNQSLTQTQIAELKAAFPNLELNNVSNPTGGTWREHPHFEVFHTFFRTGEYVPFEDSFLVEDDQPVSVSLVPDSKTDMLAQEPADIEVPGETTGKEEQQPKDAAAQEVKETEEKAQAAEPEETKDSAVNEEATAEEEEEKPKKKITIIVR